MIESRDSGVSLPRLEPSPPPSICFLSPKCGTDTYLIVIRELNEHIHKVFKAGLQECEHCTFKSQTAERTVIKRSSFWPRSSHLPMSLPGGECSQLLAVAPVGSHCNSKYYSYTSISFNPFNPFLSVQFGGIKHIHNVVGPSPPSNSTAFLPSQTETLCPLNNSSPLPHPLSPS